MDFVYYFWREHAILAVVSIIIVLFVHPIELAASMLALSIAIFSMVLVCRVNNIE